jgi:molecular chaperone GrpE
MNDDIIPDPDKFDDPDGAVAPADTDRIAELEAEIVALKDKVLYAQADTENVRRRLEKDKADAIAYASTGFARDMLSVADNLARAMAAIPAEARENDAAVKAIVTGLEIVTKELDTIFQRHGITRINALGEKIDPNRHQAMLEVAGGEAGTIVQEMQAGYMLRDRLLRPSLVGVAKGGGGPAVDGKIDAEA